jgi:diguanylate cyclase (GGDEF)-like protein
MNAVPPPFALAPVESLPAMTDTSLPVKPVLPAGSVEAAQLQLLARRDQAAIRPALAGIALVALSQLPGEPPALLALLVLLRLGALFHNHRVSARVLALGANDALGQGLLTRLENGLLVSGISWGLFAWLPPEPFFGTPSGQFMVVALVAIVGVMIHVTAPTRGALLKFMAGFWVPIMARLIASSDPQALILFGGALTHGTIVTVYGLRLCRQIRDGLVSALENQALLAELSVLHRRELAQRAALASTNRQLNSALAQATHLASHDLLTDVMNRRAFLDQLPGEISADDGHPATAALVLIDLDHFKSVNDRYGHQVGDEVLRHTAALLRANIRTTDRLARWGGEEFVLLMPATDRALALALTERLRATLNASVLLPQDSASADPSAGHVSASFGVAIVKGDESFEAALARADTALYRAKESGRNRVCCAD